MQDEIKKHTKKIYNKAMSKEHTLIEKIKDIIVEILIIVFAVSLSIWFHNWSEERHNKKDTIGFLIDLKNDLKNDSIAIENSIEDYKKNIHTLTAKDSSQNTVFVTTSLNNGNFEGFKSSGKIGHIENNELRLTLLHYYGKRYTGILSHNNMANDVLMKVITEKNVDHKTIVNVYLQEADRNIKHLAADINTISNTLKLIDKQIAD